MASSSNSPLALVTSSRSNYYDVFVTFRGEDTRNNFTDFLFDALKTKNISVFRDDTNLHKGESIGPELIRSIEGSQVFVAVFSKNYASSTWCLQELEKICECVHESGKHVLPVFYDVDPSEVRKQSKIYGEAFAKHEQTFNKEPHKVSRWREALNQVGRISGWDLRDKPQAGEIKKIVQKIMNILDCKSSFISKDLVGINSRKEVLQNHLLLGSVDGVRAIGICGMGGIGKTTLAMTLYGQISHQFSASCFIDDVSKIYRLYDGPLGAQRQILLQTVIIEHHQICNHYSATDLICRRLRHEKALLILDNVDRVEQLEEIAVHREWLGAGSRIVIISRDEQVLKAYGVDVVYKVPLLNRTNSYELFCRKAFKVEKIIMSKDQNLANEYQNLENEILRYVNGLPLAIKVLGSFLFGRNVTEWKSALARLRESPDNDVMVVLQLSFDGLKHDEKEIFLDIACFFYDWDEEKVKNILNCCGFHADIGLRVLIEKSFIIIKYSTIRVHSLLSALGRKIVQENSSKEQRKWSRVWTTKQIDNVIKEKMEKHVEAIVLRGLDGGEVDVEHLSKMSNLRLLIMLSEATFIGNISESPSCLSNKLKYIEWNKYPFKHLPSSFQSNELVELILLRSKITELWKNKKNLPNLRRLDLRDSTKLEKIIDFEEFPNLEWLNLKGCLKLVELDPSIGLLRKLVYLNLKRCTNLVSIPNTIFSLSSLQDLNLGGCSKVFNKYSLPSLHSLYCLRSIDFSYYHLSHVPDSIECLHSLERLNLAGNYFVKLPSLRKLSKLVYLNLEHCMLLESLPQLPFPTTIRRERNEIDEIDVIWARGTKIIGLLIFNCPKLCDRERCRSMTFSWMKQFIKANPRYSYEIQIVNAGSEIPSWINNQRMGYSIAMDRFPIRHDNENNIIGMVCCVLVVSAPQVKPRANNIDGLLERPNMQLIYDKFLFPIDVPITLTRDMTKSSHLWIIYIPRPQGSDWYSYRFGKIRFDITVSGMEAKSCGHRWVCKQDLQEFNLTMMNHEKSLTRRPGILAIEDETQPEPEQESFISQVRTTSQRNKSRTSISATQTEGSVVVPDTPVADEVSTESPQKKFSNLHIIGRFPNNWFQQRSMDTPGRFIICTCLIILVWFLKKI